jgi:predicted Na+-dependent transporter
MSDFVISKTLLVQRLSLILFLIVFAAIWIEEWDKITSFVQRAGLIALVLNLTMIFLGYYLAKIFSLRSSTKKMYFTRMWLTKWNFSIICWNTAI